MIAAHSKLIALVLLIQFIGTILQCRALSADYSDENRRDIVIAVLEEIAVSFLPVSIRKCQFS